MENSLLHLQNKYSPTWW